MSAMVTRSVALAAMAARARRAAFLRRRNIMMYARAASGMRRAAAAARTIQKGYRLYRGARRRYKGMTLGRIGQSKRARANAKTHLARNTDGDLRATRTLYQQELTNISEGTSINLRLKQQIYVAGVRICFQYENEQDVPVTVNFCVVHDKQSNNAVSSININDFFRATGATSRNMDFSNALTNNEFHCAPLNTDRFTVLKHERFMIGSRNNQGLSYSTTTRSYGSMLRYVKIGRKITYEDTNCQSKIWVMYWFDKFQEPATTAPTTGVVKVSEHYKLYFREPVFGA